MAIDWDKLKKLDSGITEKNVQSNSSALSESKIKTDKLEHLENEVEKKFKEKEHSTRSWLTTSFIIGLFLLIILAGFYVLIYNQSVIDLAIKAKENNIVIESGSLSFLSFKDIFSLIFNSFGPPLGFIIGYYFKEKSSK